MRIYTLLFLQRPHINSGALYTCALCDILLESLAHAFRHIRDKRHKKKAKVRTRTQMAEVAGPSPPLPAVLFAPRVSRTPRLSVSAGEAGAGDAD